MVTVMILGLIVGFWLGSILILEKVKNLNEEVHKQLWTNFRDWYNKVLDNLKSMTKEDRIKELEEKIAELKTE